ncbi:MAG: hypothetical protein Fur0022_17780 [Anaerolineales bacterium]
MLDLTPILLPRLKSHRLPGFDLGDEFVYPHYQGGSILNVASTLCAVFGIPGLGAEPLMEEITTPLKTLASNVKRIVLVLMDALALHRFQRWRAQGDLPLWGDLPDQSLLAPLTSVVPSTTSCALPSIWSGLSPAQHAMVGYELWLKEYGVVANMITHSPFTTPGNLEKAGFKPEEALPGLTLGMYLNKYGIQAHAFQHYTIAHSGLSRMFYKDTKVHAFGSSVEMAVNVRKLIESRPHERQLIGVYWGNVDHSSHLYGPDDEQPQAEFVHFSAVFRDLFVNRLPPALRKETLLLLMADHGQVTTRKEAHFDLKNHPNLVRRLPMFPTGENRLAYFFIRPGQTEAVREYMDRTFMKQFVFVDPGYAIEAGLFGPGAPHPRLRDRLGDLLAIARGDSYLWWSATENPILGRHGGMGAEEMVVPFLAMRL